MIRIAETLSLPSEPQLIGSTGPKLPINDLEGTGMGYFGGAFVVTLEPSWSKLGEFKPDISLRGYKHKNKNIWLLDYWVGDNECHEFPFIDAYEVAVLEDLPENEVGQSFSQIRHSLKRCSEAQYGGRWHKLTVAFAKTLRIPTYFFAADDESRDFACSVSADGSTELIACRFDPFHVRFSENAWTVTPVIYEDLDGIEGTVSEEALDSIRSIPKTTIAAPVKRDRMFYENPHEEWPTAASVPEEILGIGTWDPFLNLGADFSAVFERIVKQGQ